MLCKIYLFPCMFCKIYILHCVKELFISSHVVQNLYILFLLHAVWIYKVNFFVCYAKFIYSIAWCANSTVQYMLPCMFFRCMFLVIYTFYSIACCTFSLLIFYRFHAKWLIATFEGTSKYYLSLHSASFCEYCECWTRIGGGVGCGDRGWGVVVCGPCNPPPPNHRVWEGLSGWLDWAHPTPNTEFDQKDREPFGRGRKKT